MVQIGSRNPGLKETLNFIFHIYIGSQNLIKKGLLAKTGLLAFIAIYQMQDVETRSRFINEKSQVILTYKNKKDAGQEGSERDELLGEVLTRKTKGSLYTREIRALPLYNQL